MDVAAKYVLKMPAVARTIQPSHPLFELTQAVVAGDNEITTSVVTEPSFNVRSLSAPLDATGVTILHIAALANRPSIMHLLLRAADAATAQKSEMVKLQTRKEAIIVRNVSSDHATSRQGQLDALDRLMYMASEQQLLELLAIPDRRGRTVLHYAAAARGVMVDEGLFEYQSNRFAHATSSDGHSTPLFPSGAYVDPKTGDLWSPAHMPEEADLGPPTGYIPVSALSKARNDPDVIDAVDGTGATPLIYATVAGDLHAIRSLIAHGANPFTATEEGITPLDLAANRVIRAVLVPMDTAVQSACGVPAVRAGVQAPAPGATEMLSPARAATGTIDTTMSPLRSSRRSIRAGDATARSPHMSGGEMGQSTDSALMLLVNSGEDINGRTGIHLRAPLHLAAESAAVDIVRLLLNNGALVDIVDVNGCTALHLAAELGTPLHREIVKLLADAGGDINATSSLRKTPLHLAATGGPYFAPNDHPKAQTSTRQRKAQQRSESGTADDAAVLEAPEEEEANDGNAGMIKLLVDLGANIEALDSEFNTPLHAAAKRGNFFAVDTLLAIGSRIYAQNIRGHTALHVAAFHHHLPVVRQLCRWDAEVGKLKYLLDSSGRSAYDLAADASTRDALHTLFEACASGRLDLAQSVARAGTSIPLATVAPWLPVRPFEVTRTLRRSCLHVAITGAARSLAKTQVAVSKSVPAAHASGRKARANPSAVHIVAGVGLRYTTAYPNFKGPLPPDVKTKWGGSIADVEMTFFEPADDDLSLRMDPFAYVQADPRISSAHPSGKSSETGGALAARRMMHGSELTSSSCEKEFGRIVEWLLKSGCDMNDKDIDGVTAIMLSARYGLLYILRKLLSKGADTTIADRRGNTVLHYAYAFRHTAAAAIIEEFAHDSLSEIRNLDGKTPLDVAANGMSILADSAETFLTIAKPLPKSAALIVSSAR